MSILPVKQDGHSVLSFLFLLSNSLSGAVRKFSYWAAHGTVGYLLLEGIDSVADMKEKSSFIEAAYAVFMNNLEIDGKGTVLNYKYTKKTCGAIYPEILRFPICDRTAF